MQTTNEDSVLLDVRNLKKYFPINEGFLWTRQVRFIKAVDDVSFTVRPGETLGLVGESGCGKTTLGRTILQLYRPTEGHVYFEGEDLAELSGEQLRRTRRKAQMIFQDPYASLNPRMKVANIIEEPLIIHEVENGSQRREAAAHLLEMVGLNSYLGTRFPHELSGGQRQRVAVARAVALRPSLVICDEPVSALDVSIQAQVLNLLIALQEKFGLTYIFIAHDLSVVSLMSDWVMVMYLGHIVERARRAELYGNPAHPYTQALLSAVPIPDPAVERKRNRTVIRGEIPSPTDPPPGCVFNPRCPRATEACKEAVPSWREVGKDHWVACHNV